MKKMSKKNSTDMIVATIRTRQMREQDDCRRIWENMKEAASASNYEVYVEDVVLGKDKIKGFRAEGYRIYLYHGGFDKYDGLFKGDIKVCWGKSKSWLDKLVERIW